MHICVSANGGYFEHLMIHFIVCTVVQNCCKGDVLSMERPILDPQGSKTPEPIDIKRYLYDYVWDLTPHANFGVSTLKGAGCTAYT